MLTTEIFLHGKIHVYTCILAVGLSDAIAMLIAKRHLSYFVTGTDMGKSILTGYFQSCLGWGLNNTEKVHVPLPLNVVLIPPK